MLYTAETQPAHSSAQLAELGRETSCWYEECRVYLFIYLNIAHEEAVVAAAESAKRSVASAVSVRQQRLTFCGAR